MTPRNRLAWLLLPSLLAAGPALAQDVPRLGALRLDAGAAIDIDGTLDEGAWQAAVPADRFVQEFPLPGASASERTVARVLYDGRSLYVGVKAYAADPARIVRRLGRRDGQPGGDEITVAVGSPADDRTAFTFAVNAAGVQRDAVLADDRNEPDPSYDAVWDSAVAPFADATGAGYAVEIRVPFSQLRYDPAAATPWQLQVTRLVAATGEVANWAPILPDADGYVSRFGRLDGLAGLRAPRRIELLPYVSSSLTRAPGDAANPFYRANDLGPGVGLDARVGLTSGLTLTATVNPDFGQVEADPAVLNLSQFEVFFDERRPFFVEGTDVFFFGGTRAFIAPTERPTFFYSRRIGGAPAAFAQLYADTAAVFLAAPPQTTIAGAAKLSGQAGGWTLGLLSAVTAQESVGFTDTLGARRALPVAPVSAYTVARARRAWRGGRTLVGAFASNVLRDTAPEAFAARLASAATVGGLDAEVATASRAFTASAVLAGSVVGGSEAVITALQRSPQRYQQRPDGHLALDPTATRLAGYRAELALAKTGGGPNWRGSLALGATSPGFESNDLGFQPRADYLSADAYVAYTSPQPRAPWLALWRLAAYNSRGYSYGGDRVLDRYAAVGTLRFANQWQEQLTVSVRPLQDNDRLTRGGPLALRPADYSVTSILQTNAARRVSGFLRLGGRGEFAHGHRNAGREWNRQLVAGLSVRPTDALELGVDPSYTRLFNTDQYLGRVRTADRLGLGGSRYLFSDTRIASLALGLRADIAFTPTLTLQLVATPQVDAVRFSNFGELAAAGTYDFVRYGQDGGTLAAVVYDADGAETPAAPGQTPDAYAVAPGDGGDPFPIFNPDFTALSLRGNAVLRWEWRPGSAVFVVWQQVRDEFAPLGGLDVFADLPDTFAAPAVNVFLVKATYWLGL